MWLFTSLLLTDCGRLWAQSEAEIPSLVFFIDENSPAGTEMGALAELYPELNQFRFSNRSRSTLFQIHPDTGVVSVRDGAKLDFEKRSTVTLTIVADIREEQEDPYLAEFTESLRDEGFSSRALSRLIPLEQRIQLQVFVRDVREADDSPAELSETGSPEEPVAVMPHAVIASVENSLSEVAEAEHGANEPLESGSNTLAVTEPEVSGPEVANPETVKPERAVLAPSKSEPTQPERVITKTESTQAEASPPVSSEPSAVVKTVESKGAAVSNEPGLSNVEEEMADPMEPEVPMPSDVPPSIADSSNADGRTLVLSESSGQAALRLNSATSAGGGTVDSGTAESQTTQAKVDEESAAADVAAHPQRTFLLQSLVSLMIVLGTAYLLRRRWRSFRKSLPQPGEEQDAEEAALAEQDSTSVEAALQNQAELKAADDFVKEPVQEEVLPQIEHELKSVIAQNAEDDHGAPFDPESLIDDEYFNEADDLRALKAKNAELGDRLEALAEAAELAPKDPLEIDNLLAVTASLSGSTAPSTSEAKQNPSWTPDDLNDSDSELIDASKRNDRSDFAHGRSAYLTYNQDAGAPTEPRWNSDWPGYSEEMPVAATTAATEVVAELSPDRHSLAPVETTDDKIASLRSELADLFAIQKKAETSATKTVSSNEVTVPESAVTDEAVDKPEPCPEETHLESVAQYLSQLLERSKKEEAADAIFVDRRKSSDKPAGKWDGVDRRGGAPKAKAPVKSYIESYLSEHGGELSHDSGSQKSAETPLDEFSRPQEMKPPVERRPVDVQAIRQNMNSFRNVAATALEHALASHRIRQAKGKVAWRTTLVAGLTVVSVLAIATNSAMKIYFPSLGWLMGLIICLAIAELILRVEAIRRHRRELRYRILEPAKKSGDRSDKTGADGTAVAEDAPVALS